MFLGLIVHFLLAIQSSVGMYELPLLIDIYENGILKVSHD